MERKERKKGMIVLWFIVFVVCCGECLGLCLLLLHARSLSLVCVMSSMPMCHHPHPMCCDVCVCCVLHVTCSVWWLALSNTLPCCAPSSLLFSFCPSLFHHHHSQKNTQRVCGEKRGRKEWMGKEREEEEEERSDAKNEWKRGQKEKKRLRHLVFPGCLQP